MTADRTLRALQRVAKERARTAKPRQARRAAQAYTEFAQLRRDASASPALSNAICRLRAACRALAVPSRRRTEKLERGRPRAFTAAEYEAANAAGGTTKAIAHTLGVDRRTVARYRSKSEAKMIIASHSPSERGDDAR